MNRIGTYVNGNTFVEIYDDGTKIRHIKDGEESRPEFPESIDLKITNRCDLGCPMCAEQSWPGGEMVLLGGSLLKTLHPYTELAIGGGNPLEHPGLVYFLKQMQKQKVICNLTVNVRHFLKQHQFLKALTEEKLIYGLGISIPSEVPAEFEGTELFPNTVIHTIAGYTPMSVFEKLANKDLNLLILGYKLKGRGGKYLDDMRHLEYVTDNLKELSETVLDMRSRFRGVAFDNRAVKQLRLKEKLSAEEYEKLYMGDDGEFTMYIDLVTQQYGKSSTHPLKPIDATTIGQLFQNAQGRKETKGKENG